MKREISRLILTPAFFLTAFFFSHLTEMLLCCTVFFKISIWKALDWTTVPAFFCFRQSSKLTRLYYSYRLWSCLWKKQSAVLLGRRALGMHLEEFLSVYLQESSLKASWIWSLYLYLCWSNIKISNLNQGKDMLLISITILGGPGLLDPCEKDPFDTLAVMTDQQREDITSSAQVRWSMFKANKFGWHDSCHSPLSSFQK